MHLRRLKTLRKQPLLDPFLISSRKQEAIVQPFFPVDPELDALRPQDISVAVVWPRDDLGIAFGSRSNRLLQSLAAGQRSALFGGHGPQLAPTRSAMEIGVGLRIGQRGDWAFHA